MSGTDLLSFLVPEGKEKKCWVVGCILVLWCKAGFFFGGGGGGGWGGVEEGYYIYFLGQPDCRNFLPGHCNTIIKQQLCGEE